MNHLAHPTNTSLRQFREHWPAILFGALRYLLFHPISGWRVIIARLRFAMLKKNLEEPFKTPDGFTLKTNSELIVHSHVFVERALHCRRMIKEFRHFPNPTVIDIGYNAGFVTKWLNIINNSANFIGVEVMEQQARRSIEMDEELAARDWPGAPHVELHHRAAWDCDGQFITIHVGECVTARSAFRATDCSFKIQSVSVDGLGIMPGPVFMLKIDTDGSNARVLEGARKTLPRVRWLVVEKEDGVHDWLRRNLRGRWDMVKETDLDLFLAQRSTDAWWTHGFFRPLKTAPC